MGDGVSLVYRHDDLKFSCCRPVTRILRRNNCREVNAATVRSVASQLRTHYSKRLAAFRVDNAHAEAICRGNLKLPALRDDDIALDVARIYPVKYGVRLFFGDGDFRCGVLRPPRKAGNEALYFAGHEHDRSGEGQLPAGEQIIEIAAGKFVQIPLDSGRLPAIEIGEDEHLAVSCHRQSIAGSARDEFQTALALEVDVGGKQPVEFADELDHILSGAPIQAVFAVHVNLLRAIPLNAIGDSPCALPTQKRRQLHAKLRVSLAALGKAIVVVSLGKMHKRPVFLAPRDGGRQIPLELIAIVCLEYFGISPIDIRFGKQAVGHRQIAAKSLKHENGIGIFFADLRHYVLPGFRRYHVAGIATEAIDSIAAPEQEYVGDIRAKLRIGIIKLDQICPHYAPCAGRNELAVFLAMKPLRVVRLQSRCPAGMIGRQVDKE